VALQKLVAGLTEHFAGQTLPLKGGPYKTADLVTMLNAFIAQLQAADAAQVTWKELLEDVRTAEASRTNKRGSRRRRDPLRPPWAAGSQVRTAGRCKVADVWSAPG
jgi:hypothetical protein